MTNYLDIERQSSLLSHMTNHLDSFFSAISDPTRRAVVERLVGGPASVSDLHAPHDIALPTFMKHLKVLEESGLVSSEKKGRVRVVHIEAEPLRMAEDWLKKQRMIWSRRLDRIEQLAEEMERQTK